MMYRVFLLLVWISIGCYSSLYRVLNTENAIQLRANELVRDEKGYPLLKKPGLYFKVPFLDKVVTWDTRIQQTTLCSKPLMTLEEITLSVDYHLIWRIQNPADYIEHMMRHSFDLKRLFLKWLNEYMEADYQLRPLSFLMHNSSEALRNYFKSQANKIGIEIIELNVSRKIPSPDSKKAILGRIKQDQVAAKKRHIKDVNTQIARLRSEANTQETIKLTQAKEEAERIIREGELAALKLYTATYQKNLGFAEIYQRAISGTDSLAS